MLTCPSLVLHQHTTQGRKTAFMTRTPWTKAASCYTETHAACINIIEHYMHDCSVDDYYYYACLTAHSYFSVTVKMEKAVLTQSTNKLHSEIVFHCNAVLTDVIVPSSIDIDVKWFVDNKNVHSETFNAKDRVAGVLEEKHWSMGQTVRFFFFPLLSSYQLIYPQTSDLLLGPSQAQHRGSPDGEEAEPGSGGGS